MGILGNLATLQVSHLFGKNSAEEPNTILLIKFKIGMLFLWLESSSSFFNFQLAPIENTVLCKFYKIAITIVWFTVAMLVLVYSAILLGDITASDKCYVNRK